MWAKGSLDKAIKYGIIVDGILVGILQHQTNYYSSTCTSAINLNQGCMLKSLDAQTYTLSPQETVSFLENYNNKIASLIAATQ